MTIKRFPFFVIIIFHVLHVMAQKEQTHSVNFQGSIQGKVLDKHQNPIEYANVILYAMPDSLVVGGCVTKESGQFKIENIKNGNYSIRIQFIGFSNKYISNIAISDAKKSISLGTIIIQSKTDEIDEVVVTAKQKLIETKLDKKIVNVDPGIAATGGTAVDVLKDVPSVQVDIDGGVSLRGSENVTILIDGRPSTYSSLDQVPASIIDRIEIVTNPSAKYEASGMAGIINIITKKKIQKGYSGQVQLNATTNGRYSGNVIANYGKEKLNTYVVIDGRRMVTKVNEYQLTNDLINKGFYSTDTSFSKRKGVFGSAKLGFDIKLNENNTISYWFQTRQGSFTSNQNSVSNSMFYNQFLSILCAENNTKSGFNANTSNISYKWKGRRKDEELNISNVTQFNFPVVNHSFTDYGASYIDNASKNIYEYNPFTEITYARPILTEGMIETGIAYGFYEMKNSNTRLTENKAANEEYELSKNIKYWYGQYSNSLTKKILYQIGVRAEQISSSYRQISNNIEMDSMYIYPSASLSYKKNDTMTVTLNYSKRVNYPDIQMMSPNLIQGDFSNWTKGNPNLYPEFVHSFELTITHTYKNLTINNTLYLRHSTNTLQRKQYVYTDTIEPIGSISREKLVTTVINGNDNNAWGIEHFHNYNISRRIKYSFNGSLFITDFSDTLISKYFTTPFISGLSKINITYSPFKNFESNVSVQYSSPSISMKGGSGRSFSIGGSAGKIGQSYQTDISMKKIFLKGNASVSIRMSDVFATNRFEIDYYRPEAHIYNKRIRNSRTLFVGLMYKINGGNKQKKKTQDINPDMDF